MAITTFAPYMRVFRRARDFSAWLGLVPRPHSSGGKQKLGRTSKMGQRDIRRLLIMGVMSIVHWKGRAGGKPGSWLSRMIARKPRMLVAIALQTRWPGWSGPCSRETKITETRRAQSADRVGRSIGDVKENDDQYGQMIDKIRIGQASGMQRAASSQFLSGPRSTHHLTGPRHVEAAPERPEP